MRRREFIDVGMGQSRSFLAIYSTSAIPPRAEVQIRPGQARNVPQCDMVSRLFDHLIGAGTKLEAPQPAHGFTGNLENVSLCAAPRAHSGNVRIVVDPLKSELSPATSRDLQVVPDRNRHDRVRHLDQTEF
jgi:hypothetical protein